MGLNANSAIALTVHELFIFGITLTLMIFGILVHKNMKIDTSVQ